MDFDLEWQVECPYCEEEVDIDLKDYVVDVSGNEREMGTETEYTIECEGLNCPNCNKHFGIRGSIWEYPEGAYNDDTLETIKEDEDNDEDLVKCEICGTYIHIDDMKECEECNLELCPTCYEKHMAKHWEEEFDSDVDQEDDDSDVDQEDESFLFTCPYCKEEVDLSNSEPDIVPGGLIKSIQVHCEYCKRTFELCESDLEKVNDWFSENDDYNNYQEYDDDNSDEMDDDE